MVTKRSKLYPAVKLCQSMIDYYQPSFLDHISESEYNFIKLYELKKRTSEDDILFYRYITSFHNSYYDSLLRLGKFFYEENAIKIDHATLLYLSIIDKLFQSYFYFSEYSITEYSITDIYYYINFDFLLLASIPFYHCISDICKEKEKFKRFP